MNISCDTVVDIRQGQLDDEFEAWLFNLFIRNNLLHYMNPELIASRDQLSFMVHLAPDQVYLPCSDEIFFSMTENPLSPKLRKEYSRCWRIFVRLIRFIAKDNAEKKKFIRFCRIPFHHIIKEHTLIPSRLTKRLVSTAISLSGIPDPWLERRRTQVRLHMDFLSRPEVKNALDYFPTETEVKSTLDDSLIEKILPTRHSIHDIRLYMSMLIIARYACLSSNARNWSKNFPSIETLTQNFRESEKVFTEVLPQLHFLQKTPTVLFLCNADGGILYDFGIVKELILRGCKVIYAVKESVFFYSPTIEDAKKDPILNSFMKKIKVCTDNNLSKNELLHLLHEWHVLVISDGTQERLNLARTSVTFARSWKEADVILCHGWRKRETLFNTSHSFTRDILLWWQDKNGFHVEFKPKAPEVHKWSEQEISARADEIIAGMQKAKEAGKTVVFYSCIIGSLPGQTDVAIRVVTSFVQHLRSEFPSLYVINPAEHFVEGMDGDDLMYMWERVQRSGLINIWRFQSAEDIMVSFELMHETIPPLWIGKDSTYSTGCTKEMRIAVDVQKTNPEMQIMGPSLERFFRRDSYGVGKFFDASLVKTAE